MRLKLVVSLKKERVAKFELLASYGCHAPLTLPL